MEIGRSLRQPQSRLTSPVRHGSVLIVSQFKNDYVFCQPQPAKVDSMVLIASPEKTS
jgi:hypothetical protein